MSHPSGDKIGIKLNSLSPEAEDSGSFEEHMAREAREKQRLSKKEEVRYESGILCLNKEILEIPSHCTVINGT